MSDDVVVAAHITTSEDYNLKQISSLQIVLLFPPPRAVAYLEGKSLSNLFDTIDQFDSYCRTGTHMQQICTIINCSCPFVSCSRHTVCVLQCRDKCELPDPAVRLPRSLMLKRLRATAPNR